MHACRLPRALARTLELGLDAGRRRMRTASPIRGWPRYCILQSKEQPENPHIARFGDVLPVRWTGALRILPSAAALRHGRGARATGFHAPTRARHMTELRCPCRMLGGWRDSRPSLVRICNAYAYAHIKVGTRVL